MPVSQHSLILAPRLQNDQKGIGDTRSVLDRHGQVASMEVEQPFVQIQPAIQAGCVGTVVVV